jgi:hypothetical protein
MFKDKSVDIFEASCRLAPAVFPLFFYISKKRLLSGEYAG